MSTFAIVVCFIFIGIAGIANLVALFYLFLSLIEELGFLIDDFGFCERKSNSSYSTFKLFIHQPIPNGNDDFALINDGEKGEEDKTTCN